MLKGGVQGFPTDLEDTTRYYIVLSTGDATHYAEGQATHFESCRTFGPSSHILPGPYGAEPSGEDYWPYDYDSYDVAKLSLSLEVPWDAAILSFDWKFLTEELPTAWGFGYDGDWAMAIVRVLNASAGISNILLLPDGNPVIWFPGTDERAAVSQSIDRFFNRVTGSRENPLPPYPSPNDVVFNAATSINEAWFDVTSFLGKLIQIDFWIADAWDGYRDSALFLDNLRFGPPRGNFIAQGIRAIQTLPDVDLVLNKFTAFNISYSSTFQYSIETDVRIDLTGFGDYHGSNIPSYTFRTVLNPGSNYFYVDYDLSINSRFYTRSKTISYRVTLDPYDVIPEWDEYDNSVYGPSDVVRRPVEGGFLGLLLASLLGGDECLDILFVRLHHEDEPSVFRITEYDLSKYASDAMLFLYSVYPLASVNHYVSPQRLLVEDGWDWTDILDELEDRQGAYDRVVGVANASWLGWDDSDLFKGSNGLTGEYFSLTSLGMVHYTSAMVKNSNQGTVAHEIGHTYGLGDDYSGGSDGAGTEICETGSGYWVVRGEERTNLETFMHAGFADRWVDDTDYNLLMNLFVMADPEILHLDGVIFRNGSAELSEQLYHLSQGEAGMKAGSVGNYYIALIDDLGNTLSRVGFNVTFQVLSDPPREVDEEYFSLTVEWASGTRVIQLQNASGSVLAARNVSLNPPTVTVTSPDGGETFTPGTDHTITWSAEDPDGDTLTYDVFISNGADLKPVAIATGLDQTSLTYDFADLPGGNQYLIHVIANDGVNVGCDVSDGFFTVSYFTINVIGQLQMVSEGGNATYALNITSYGGFSGPVTLSAESPTAPNLMFRWVNGTTVVPTPSGSINVFLEVEVPEGTEGGYHTVIVSGVADNSLQVAMASLFVLSHDIAVIGVTPSNITVNPGDIVLINITVQNQGFFNEIFDVAAYYGRSVYTNIVQEQWVGLHAGVSKTLTFTWNTTGLAPGNYTISAYAYPVPLETDTADNGLGAGDLYLASVMPSVSTVGQGFGCKINTTIANLAAWNENAEATVYAQINDATDGLAAYWGFDQTSGTTAFDASGNHYDGRFSPERAWEWQTPGDVEGWIPWNEVADFSCDGVSLNGRATGSYPFISSPENLAIDSTKAKSIHLRMKVSEASYAQIFFITNTDTEWNEAKKKVFNTKNPGQWVDYNVSFADVPSWTGTITQIRLDPLQGVEVGATFSVDWFRVGSNPRWVRGVSLSLDGLDDHVSAPFIPLNDRSFTITAWFAAKDLTTDAPLLSQMDSPATDKYLHLLIRNSLPYFGFYGDDLWGSTVINTNRFYHVAFVYNNTNHHKYIYLDGVLDASGPSGAYMGEAGNTAIGEYGRTFNGTLDEVRVYNRALDQRQIEDVMNSGACVYPQTVALAPGEQANLTFTWDTTGWPMANYTIYAVVWPVGDEVNVENNFLAGSHVLVTIPGDVTGEGSCDMQDISIIIDWFMTSHPDYNANCDINGDLTIDMADISIAIDHFMQT
jgi:hypothetical protein